MKEHHQFPGFFCTNLPGQQQLEATGKENYWISWPWVLLLDVNREARFNQLVTFS
jgi:hypothetical protein